MKTSFDEIWLHPEISTAGSPKNHQWIFQVPVKGGRDDITT